jgi:hypothetical protein
MAEILAGGGIHKAFKDLDINAKRTYKSAHEPYYEVWEVDKKDLRTLDEVEEWSEQWGWYRYARGSNLGTPADFFTVNGQFMIGWESRSGNDTYDTLLEYFCDGIGASQPGNVIALAVDLARANGKTVAKLFQTYEG